MLYQILFLLAISSTIYYCMFFDVISTVTSWPVLSALGSFALIPAVACVLEADGVACPWLVLRVCVPMVSVKGFACPWLVLKGLRAHG